MEEKLTRVEGAAPALPAKGSLSRSGDASEASRSERRARTVDVDCDKRESVTEAVAKADPATPIVVRISGTCRETVRIERSDVTLAGMSSTDAVIRPPSLNGQPTGPGIRARNAHGLAVRDITVREGTDGILVLASSRVTLTRVTATLNNGPSDLFGGVEGFGAAFEASEATITESDLSGNQAPLVALRGSTVVVLDSKVSGNSLDGPFSFDNSALTLIRSVIADNAFGPQAVGHSFTHVIDSTIDGGPDAETFAVNTSRLLYRNSTITNIPAVTAAGDSVVTLQLCAVSTSFVSVLAQSMIEILGSTFDLAGDPEANLTASGRSHVRVRPLLRPDGTVARSNFHGFVFLQQFADGFFETDDPVPSISCSGRARVFTNQTAAWGPFGCE
jgi:hypothetical protein